MRHTDITIPITAGKSITARQAGLHYMPTIAPPAKASQSAHAIRAQDLPNDKLSEPPTK